MKPPRKIVYFDVKHSEKLTNFALKGFFLSLVLPTVSANGDHGFECIAFINISII